MHKITIRCFLTNHIPRDSFYTFIRLMWLQDCGIFSLDFIGRRKENVYYKLILILNYVICNTIVCPGTKCNIWYSPVPNRILSSGVRYHL